MKYLNVLLGLFFLVATSQAVFAEKFIQTGFLFLTTTPEFSYQYTHNKKTMISATLVVENVGGVVVKGYEVITVEHMSEKNNPVIFTFTKPTKGWPEGDYKVVIKEKSKVLRTAQLSFEKPSVSNSASAPVKKSNRTGVLAQGQGGQLTATAANAYVDALAFVLLQLGQPRSFTSQERQIIVNNLSTHYASFPVDTQQDLAAAKQILNEYQQSWSYLGIDEQKEFAYSVLVVAYGEQAAAQALGIDDGYSSGGGGDGGSYYSDGSGAAYVSDGKCAIFSSEYGSISSCD